MGGGLKSELPHSETAATQKGGLHRTLATTSLKKVHIYCVGTLMLAAHHEDISNTTTFRIGEDLIHRQAPEESGLDHP